ncbi:SusD family protein [Pedobacter sp. ok626]|uniref:RagB/SusD family nutrient uptake outer membrane protein n=1 Tax=Pedobacter sp. ok626 TaxID=1761882 RepID=UPI000886F2C9|nr:RagB/SusD family nutrient uptake outer membrane protein [Pedobacter sp. ok626]SDJ59603.1 SusD family protein [Pedobacter sp. ok626]
MKNLNKNILLIGSFVTMLSIVSCTKSFLDQKPYTSISREDALKTAADIKTALNGTYANLRNGELRGAAVPLLGDLLADNIYLSTVNIGLFNGENAYSITTDGAYSNRVWFFAYANILQANNIIDAELNQGADVLQYKGEAYAIRALVYFDLVRLFGKPYTTDPNSLGVPVVLHYDPAALPKRNTVAEVYTQILSDLDKAINLMSQYNGSARFSKYAAIALKAKVSLYNGDYQNAYDLAKDVLSNSGFTPVNRAALTGYWASATPHDGDNKVETLFELASDVFNNNGSDELSMHFVQADNSEGEMLTTQSLYDAYTATDVRKSLILKGVRNRVGGENPAYIVNKYPVLVGDFNEKKVIRFSEVQLIAAEAAYRINKEPEAIILLNALMAQRDPSLTYHSSGLALLADIVQERRKELAFEGDRFFDLNRLNQDIMRTEEYPSGIIEAGDYRRVMPMPLGEINVNPNIIQNPDYH